MSGWRYGIARKYDEANDQNWYSIVECYYNDEDKMYAWSVEPETEWYETKEEIIADLSAMIADVTRYGMEDFDYHQELEEQLCLDCRLMKPEAEINEDGICKECVEETCKLCGNQLKMYLIDSSGVGGVTHKVCENCDTFCKRHGWLREYFTFKCLDNKSVGMTLGCALCFEEHCQEEGYNIEVEEYLGYSTFKERVLVDRCKDTFKESWDSYYTIEELPGKWLKNNE